MIIALGPEDGNSMHLRNVVNNAHIRPMYKPQTY
jgi:hypothetical protein